MANNLQVAKNMVFCMLGFVINFGLSFFLTPFLIKNLGTEAYSFFPLTNSLIGYTSILTTAVGSMAARFIIMEFYGGSMEKAKEYYNSVIVAYIFLSVIFTLLATICIVNLEVLINIPENILTDVKWLFGLSALCMIVSLPIGMLSVGLTVKNKNHLSSISNLICNLFRALALILLFLILPANLIYIGIAGLIYMLISILYNFYFKRRYLPEINFNPKKYFRLKSIGTLVSSGMWNSINQLSNILLLQFDLLLANLFLSAMAMGQYAIAKTIPNLFLTIIALLSNSFNPQINILYAQGRKEEMQHEITKSIKVVSALVSIPLGLLIVFGDTFFHLWIPSENSEYLALMSSIILIPMIFGASVNPVYGVFGIINKLRIPAMIMFVSGAFQTILALVLLKTTSLGLLALPVSAAVQGGIRNFFFTPIYAAKCLGYKWNYFYPSVLKGCLGLLITIAIAIIIKRIAEPVDWLYFFLSTSIAGIICLGINGLVIFKKSERNLVFNRLTKAFAN